jgi:hypothetical protein
MDYSPSLRNASKLKGVGRKPLHHKRELRKLLEVHGYEKLKRVLLEEDDPGIVIKINDMLLKYGVGTTSSIVLESDEILEDVMAAAAETMLAYVPQEDREQAWSDFVERINHQFGKESGATEESVEVQHLAGEVVDDELGDGEIGLDS